MLERDYKIVLELMTANGAKLGQVCAKIDWEPAREWVRFHGIRRGLLPIKASFRSTNIQPLWDSGTGEPYLQGFRVTVSGEECRSASEDFTTRYFDSFARQASAHFVNTGGLKEGDRFQYLVAAYPDNGGVQSSTPPGTPSDPPDGAQLKFESREIEPEIFYDDKPLSESMEGAVPEGVVCEGDMPLFVPHQILDEVEEATLSARGTETGGILIGHLLRDEKLPEIFAEVTAQIPVQASGGTHKLTFGPETWTAVRAAVDIRNRGEIYLGFWHSHPVIEWCKSNECSVDKLKTCPLAKGFLSADDLAMLRTVFPRAYSVALVCSDPPIGKPTFSLFGWRGGRIESRGFHISKPGT